MRNENSTSPAHTSEFAYLHPRMWLLNRARKNSRPVPGQVDFLTGQVTFEAHLPSRQESRQVVLQQNHSRRRAEVAPGKQNGRAAYPEDKPGFKVFFEPCTKNPYSFTDFI